MGFIMIIEPFNLVFIVMFAIFIGILVAASLILKNKSRKTKRIVLASAMIFTFVAYWAYKIALSMDGDYSDIRVAEGLPPFSWWTELPLQLCNINLMLIPLAAIFDNKKLYSFCYFVAPLGAFMAMAFPCTGFSGYSIWLPRNLGFYFTHIMIVIGAIAIATFDLYKPAFKQVLHTLHVMMVITIFIEGFDFFCYYALGKTQVNYFYAMNHEGISILEMFYNILPVQGLYLVLCGVFILLPYILIQTSIFEHARRMKDKRAKKRELKLAEEGN